MRNEYGIRCYICNKVLSDMEERSHMFLDGKCTECTHIINQTQMEIDETLAYKKYKAKKDK